MTFVAAILLVAVIVALCIPKPSSELKGDTPAEQLVDIGKGCGNVILGIIAFAVVMALVTLAGEGTLTDMVEQTRIEQQHVSR